MPSPSGATAKFGFPYLNEADVPDVATASELLAQGVENVIASYSQGVAASLPSAGVAGRIYYATDTAALSYDNGSGWIAFFTPPPGSVLGSPTSYNPGSLATYSLATETSLTVVDTTNATLGPFNVPANGRITVEASVECALQLEAAAGFGSVTLGFLNHAGGAIIAPAEQVLFFEAGESTGVVGSRVLYKCLVTGLTPGALQLDLAYIYSQSNGTGGFIYAGGAQGPMLLTAYVA